MAEEYYCDYRLFKNVFYKNEPNRINSKQFIQHEDPQISSLSADLISDSYELSKIWEEKQNYIETEEMKLKDIVGDAVLKFKSDKIKILRKELMSQLEDAVKADNKEKIIQLQKKHATLSLALGEISKQLGGRILL